MIKVTPDTYIKMNQEFERENTPFKLVIPTQQQIDDASNKPEDYQQNDHQESIVHTGRYTTD